MRRISTVFTVMLLLVSSLGFSQTRAEKEKILQNTNVPLLEQLGNDASQRFQANKERALQMANEKGWIVREDKDGRLRELVGVTPEGEPLYYTTFNVAAAKSTRANTLHNGGLLGLNIEGQNMTAHVWDGGLARTTHQEYDGAGGNNRFSIGDGTTGLHYHSAHVTGTIIASGVVANAKGMAPKAYAVGYEWNNDVSEATTAAANGMMLSNHSYGYIASNIPDAWFGQYGTDAHDWDALMYNAPYYLMCVAAGNDGDDNSSNASPLGGNSSYDKLSGHATAKNNLVVANAQDANIDASGNLVSVSINSSSSEGPTDDYRIKPDITGNGTSVYSTYESSDNAYNSITGTSMATPNVTGTLVLLQQYYNSLYGNYMRAATLKGLALHTADDAGTAGPDAIFGWGLMNAKKAAQLITGKGTAAIIDERSLSNGGSYTINVTASGEESLLASISWTDPAGTANSGTNSSTPALVNDLDIRITRSGTTYYPYKLSSLTINTTADNTVDPYERINVSSPVAGGVYTITVTHKGTLSSSQNYSLIVSGISIATDVPQVSTSAMTNITKSTATAGGNVINQGASTVTERGIVWSLNENPTTANNKVISGSGVGTFSANLTGLTANTTYYVRAYAINSAGTAYGSQVSFTTLLVDVPQVSTSAVSNISNVTATVGGEVTNQGAYTVSERGVVWSLTANPTTANNKITSGSGLGTYSVNLTGLTSNTTYYVRAYAINSAGTAYGSEVSFTTLEDVTLPVTENFNTSGMPVGWTTQNIGSGITERWNVNNTANAGGSAYEMRCSYQQVNPGTTRLISPAINTVGVSQVTFSFRHQFDDYGAGATLRVQTSNDKTTWTNTPWSLASASNATSTAATVTVDITTNLNSASTYFALVIDGNLYQFDYWYIDNVSITGGTVATVPTVTTGTASDVTTNTATITGNVTADGGASVTTRGICYSTTQNPTTSSAKVAVGTGTGSFTANLTGLSDNTTYYARAYATNSAGTSYGAEISFTTQENSNSLSLPVTENFNASSLPTGWTTHNTGSGITERWNVNNSATAGGSAYEMRCSYQQVSPATTRLITPAVNTLGVSQVTFSFRHVFDDYASGATLRIQTSNDQSTWTNTPWSIASASNSTSSAATVTVNITTNLNSATTYFAFVVDGNLYQIDYWYIDNVSITAGSAATAPTVATGTASNVATSSATVSGNVTADGGASVTTRGICYATTQNPTTANAVVASGSGTGSFSANLTGLTANTTYYARAYATNSAGTSYGAQISFTTPPSGGTTSDVTVGTGTSTQGYPLNCYYGYERSASLYTAAEIGKVGSISKVGWYPTATRSTSIPVKIYIKHTTATTITASTWATMISGATLVYDGTMAGLTANAWKEFVLSTPFDFTGGSNNLLVLVETNYGGSGTGTSAGPAIRYTSATSKHMYLRKDSSAPTTNGTVTSYRPNIKITITTTSSAPSDNSNDVELEFMSATTDFAANLVVYPNPTNGIVTIESNGNVQSISVYTITGQRVYSKTNIMEGSSNEVNLSDFDNGIYLLVVFDGENYHNVRVIKQ